VDERVEALALGVGHLDGEALLLEQAELVVAGAAELEADRGEELLGGGLLRRLLEELLSAAFGLWVRQVRGAGALLALLPGIGVGFRWCCPLEW
jgi:hypothetical protein